MLTNEMKRHAMIVALKAKYGDLKSFRFLKFTIYFVNKIRRELKKEDRSVLSLSKRKNHSKRSDFMRMPEFFKTFTKTLKTCHEN